MLGDQEPCTADRGCRAVSVEFVVLLSSLLLTCRVGVLTESQYYSSLKLNTEHGGTITRNYNRVNNMRAIRVSTPLYTLTCTQLSIRVPALTSSLGPIYLSEECMTE